MEERDDLVVENDEYVEAEFAGKEYDERVNFVFQRILIASKGEGQCKNLFKTHCYIKSKVSNLIVENDSTENLV